MSTIYLVRHAQTAHNFDGKGLGREDAPLTELGEAQVREVAGRFAGISLSRVLSSPLSRARLTADAIAAAAGCEVEVRNELIELDVGETEGLTFAEMRERFPEFMRLWGGEDPSEVQMPGGERLTDLAERTHALVEELSSTKGDEAVAVVSHNFVIKVLLCQFLGVPIGKFRRFQVDLASVSTLSVRNGRAAVIALNDVCHIETLNLA